MRTAIHAFDGVSMFHLAAPQLVFDEVGPASDTPGWSTVLWSGSGPSVRTAEGHTLGDLAGPEAADDADVVVIPSWPHHLPPLDEPLRDVLVGAHARGATVVGLCLGAFAVADAGLLDGRAAVTHWRAASQLTERHPTITVDPSVLYIDHGDVLTSAGTASSIDACLHLVRDRLGAATANRVARSLVVAPHRTGGQAQFIERPLARPAVGDPIAEVVSWALARLDEPLPIDRLAAHARMSRRSFVRAFARATGTTPARWVQERRLDAARELLETTDWGVDRIAAASGFASTVTFRQNFVATYGTPPSAYRRQFDATTPPERVTA